MPKLGRYVLQFYKASLRLWWALASLDRNSPCASMAYPSCVTCCISESSVADDSWAMITAVTEKIYCQELESESSHCLPFNFCDIVTCHKSVKDNIELCNFYPPSLSQRSKGGSSLTQLFSAPLRGSSRPVTCQALANPNLEGPGQ